MDVKCPGCKRVAYETTDQYDPDTVAHGYMLQLKQPWRGFGWDTYGAGGKGRLAHGEMECAFCGAILPINGKIVVMSEPEPEPVIEEKPVFTCEVCGKSFTAKIALIGHMRSHKKKPEPEVNKNA